MSMNFNWIIKRFLSNCHQFKMSEQKERLCNLCIFSLEIRKMNYSDFSIWYWCLSTKYCWLMRVWFEFYWTLSFKFITKNQLIILVCRFCFNSCFYMLINMLQFFYLRMIDVFSMISDRFSKISVFSGKV